MNSACLSEPLGYEHTSLLSKAAPQLRSKTLLGLSEEPGRGGHRFRLPQEALDVLGGEAHGVLMLLQLLPQVLVKVAQFETDALPDLLRAAIALLQRLDADDRLVIHVLQPAAQEMADRATCLHVCGSGCHHQTLERLLLELVARQLHANHGLRRGRRARNASCDGGATDGGQVENITAIHDRKLNESRHGPQERDDSADIRGAIHLCPMVDRPLLLVAPNNVLRGAAAQEPCVAGGAADREAGLRQEPDEV
mmetsp:Transcript_50452/g.128310  ORF Transcript_50452/g.128310 Transcript_50452/m.128310 type:complete len:252 (-) Transcript_50452:870-1625(-)